MMHFFSAVVLAAAVSFTSDGTTLRGDFSPAPGAGAHPAIVLLPGSGRSTHGGVVFETLTKRFNRDGFGVLAYDKRGAGESGGTYDDNTPLAQLARDALAGIHYLQKRPDVDPSRIGIWGVSQGGWLGPLAASMSNDVAFVISVSGPGVSIAEQSIYLRASQMLAKGYSTDDVSRMTNFRRVLWAYYGTGLGRDAAQNALDMVKNDRWFKDAQLPATLSDPAQLDPALRVFMKDAATYDPLAVARKVRVPVLSIFGAKDSIAPAAESVANLIDAYKAGGNTQAQFALFPDAGHGLQRVTTERECHECSERQMEQTRTWDAAPGFFELMDTWLAALPSRQALIRDRGEHVMPFSMGDTMHMFSPSASGGTMEVMVHSGDAAQIALVRKHLRTEAAAFARGDFSDPAYIHGNSMPGLQALRAGHAKLRVRYSDTSTGGTIEFTSSNPALVSALHAWFRAQVSDHGADAMMQHR